MNESNIMSPLSANNPNLNHNNKLAGFIVVLIALVLSIFIFFNRSYFYSRPSSSVTPSPSVSHYQPSMEQIRRTYLERAKYNFPDLASSSIISLESLPSDLLFLFNKVDGTNTEFQKIDFTNGQIGYSAGLTLGYGLRAAFTAYALVVSEEKGWEVIKGTESTLLSIMEIQNPRYQARIIETETSGDQTKVEILIIIK